MLRASLNEPKLLFTFEKNVAKDDENVRKNSSSSASDDIIEASVGYVSIMSDVSRSSEFKNSLNSLKSAE